MKRSVEYSRRGPAGDAAGSSAPSPRPASSSASRLTFSRGRFIRLQPTGDRLERRLMLPEIELWYRSWLTSSATPPLDIYRGATGSPPRRDPAPRGHPLPTRASTSRIKNRVQPSNSSVLSSTAISGFPRADREIRVASHPDGKIVPPGLFFRLAPLPLAIALGIALHARMLRFPSPSPNPPRLRSSPSPLPRNRPRRSR